MSYSKSLRSKLARKKKVSRSQEPTQVIYLDTIIDDLKNLTDLHKTNQEKTSWFQKFEIQDIKQNETLVYYKKTLEVLTQLRRENPNYPFRWYIKEALLSLYTSGGMPSEILSRETRKQIFRRLSSLLQSAEVFFEILSGNEVRRAILGERLEIRVHKEGGVLHQVPLFYCEEENELVREILCERIDEKGVAGVFVYEGEEINIIIERLTLRNAQSDIVLKPVSRQNVNMLELIRAKMFNPVLSKSFSKMLKERTSGMLISGAANTGKSFFLSGLLSTLPLQRIPLVIGNSARLRVVHPHALVLDSVSVVHMLESRSLEEVATEISKMGITDIFIDDFTTSLLPLVKILTERYSMYPVVSIHGAMRGVLQALSSTKDDIDFLCKHFLVVLDLGEVCDDRSLKGLYEIKNKDGVLTCINIAEKVEGSFTWNNSGNACESSRYFDTLKLNA